MGAVSLEHVATQDQPGEFAFPDDLDESGGLQFFQMMRKRRSRNRLALSYFRAGDARLVCAELLQNVVPSRICERPGDQPDLAFR